MKPRRAPSVDPRRAKQLESELFERARAWVPSWGMDGDERDFGRALLTIAARLSSEVSERLDRAGDRMRLAFLDWLAVPTEAARPARLPLVFELSDSAEEAVLAGQGTRLQVEAAGLPVILETEKDVSLQPGRLAQLVGVDAGADAFYLPPPGLSSLAPLEPLPTQWLLKSFASAGAPKLQLDPELGLSKDMLIELGGRQYRVAETDKDIVTIEPPLAEDQPEQSLVAKVASFEPFDGAAHNQQEHALYLGHQELFDVEAAATIEIAGAKPLTGVVSWEYWGKKHPDDAVGWQPLQLAAEALQVQSNAIVLEKPRGAVELTEIVEGKSSRWLRALARTVTGSDPLLRADRLDVRMNCLHAAPLPAASAGATQNGPSAEGMANTTPLVLDDVFFPFGQEPRQFDAFYLGSKEAFSKKGAAVTLAFDMADTTFGALTAVRRGFFGNSVLAGVAQDGSLHLFAVSSLSGAIGRFRDRDPLRPRADALADEGEPILLDRRPEGRLPIWRDLVDPDGFLVAVPAGETVWVWREHSLNRNASGWSSLGNVPTAATAPSAPIDDLVYVEDSGTLFVLRGGQLSARQWPGGSLFTPIETRDGGNAVALVAIAPVLVVSGDSFLTASAEGMIGVSDDGHVYRVAANGACSLLSPTDVSAEVRPVAVRSSGGDLLVALAHSNARDLVMFHSGLNAKDIQLAEPEARAVGFDAVLEGGSVHFLAAVELPPGGYLVSWTPHTAPGDDIEPFRAAIPAATGQPGGTPVVLGGRVVVPGHGGDLLAAGFDLTKRFGRTADLGEAVFTSEASLRHSDVIVREVGTGFESQLITQTGTTANGQTFYLLDAAFSSAATGSPHGIAVTGSFRTGDLTKGTNEGTLQLEATDLTTVKNSVVRVGTEIFRVTDDVDPSGLATIEPEPAADVAGAPYWTGVPITGRLSPFMRLDSANNDWDASLLGHATLRFENGAPAQRGTAFAIGSGNRPVLIELGSPWTTAPASAAAAFVLDAAVGAWTRFLGDTSTNPELSWEYWNGTGWWKLDVLDDTLHLKKSGTLSFDVPVDLLPTDWSGRTNYWIRARLIGGDYGREKVSVATSPPDSQGVTHQTVERSTEDIHAPAVVRLAIAYEICENVPPEIVLTRDSGSLRDQSDANRTAGATVEAFVPLGVTLARLSSAAPAANDRSEPDCSCPGPAREPAAPSANAARPAAPASALTGRALYVGFDDPPTGEPVNVLLLVEERGHDEFAPMTVEAFVSDHFVPLVVDDTTRAAGESGVLTLAFAVEPTPRELFGRTLSWLRLAPAAGASATDWRPKIRGAYLNAVWASAAETLTYELVGSSQGEPDLALFLAKPPVLRDTLELRVREPLGEEERAELRQRGRDLVRSNVDSLPGDWVLWRRVTDPADEAATERVYALDDATGEIRFGDGRHGKIPPIGRDAVVAFRYRRTETGAPGSPDVPGNTISARTPLDLVSPVGGVEAVFAAEQAAGGAPAESTDRVLRFGVARLRHRERAVTSRDIEDLALESSPDIVQARCLMRRGFVRLVVVMRGADPMPGATEVRELTRLLRGQAPPALGARGMLRIGGPAVRRLRVNLRLRVVSLDASGAVARDARDRLIALFDTLTGGAAADGWPLGENPTEGDIAMALASVPRLEGIASVALREITADGVDRPWPASLRETELAMLHEDVIRVEFETVGASE